MTGTQSAKRSRFFLHTIFIVTVLLLVAYFCIWTLGARGIQQEVERWIDNQRSAGLTISHGEIKTMGFPFLLRVRIDSVLIEQNNIGQWQSDHLFIDALPYDLTRLIFSPKGQQTINVKTLAPPYHQWTASADDIRFSIGRSKTTEWKFAFQTDGAKMQNNDATIILSVGDMVLNISPDIAATTTITTALTIDNATYATLNNQEQVASDLTVSLDNIQLSADIERTDLLGSADGVTDWINQNAHLQLHRVGLAIAPAQLLANGRLTLDRDGYPAGTVTNVLTRPGNFITALDHLGLIAPGEKDTLTASLAMASLATGGVIKNQIELRNGNVFVDGVAVAELEKILHR